MSIIIRSPHFPIGYFIPSCCLDDILTACILSVGQCGILTMIDTPILAVLYEKKIFENVETSLYNPAFVSRTVWNTNNDRYSDFGHFI